MAEWIDFDLKNSEFTDRDGNVIACGWLDIELSGDGNRFDIESVRYAETPFTKSTGKDRKVPTHVADFIADWFLTPDAQKAVRQAYTDALIERDENRADDRAEWGVQFLSAAE